MSNKPAPTQPASALKFLAGKLDISPDQLRADAMEMVYTKIGFRPGDMVKIDPESPFSYEVANLKKFPNGWMVGLSSGLEGCRVDYWNPIALCHASSTTRDTQAPH